LGYGGRVVLCWPLYKFLIPYTYMMAKLEGCDGRESKEAKTGTRSRLSLFY